MYGWRARLGLIVPSTNTTVEPEFHAFAPRGVASFATRVPVAEATRAEDKVGTIVAMRARLDAAALEVASLGPAVIGYACTSGSFLEGRDSDRATCSALAALTGIPVLTTSTALTAALATLGATKVALVTPYIEPVSAGAREYLAQTGVEVVGHADLGLLSNLDKGRLGAEESYRLARTVDVDGAEAVVISCTNWRTLDIAGALEADLGIPVVTSNQATLWALLRLAGISEPLLPSGRLLSEPLASVPDYVFP